jgi:hypothetical protein
MKRPRSARMGLQGFIESMVVRFHVAPQLWWNEKGKKWQIDFDAHGRSNLIGTLVIQLMFIIANKGVAICSACSRTFEPNRMPDTRRVYCPTCRNAGVPHRDAQRDFQARNDRTDGATARVRRPKPAGR